MIVRSNSKTRNIAMNTGTQATWKTTGQVKEEATVEGMVETRTPTTETAKEKKGESVEQATVEAME